MKKRRFAIIAFVLLAAMLIPSVALAENPKLATPQNLSWGPNYVAQWDVVPNSEGYYDIALYDANGEVESYGLRGWLGDNGTVDFKFGFDIPASGSYYFTVQARASDEYEASDIATSTTISYTKPNQSFAAPTDLAWVVEGDEIWCEFTPPANFDENRDRYNIRFFTEDGWNAGGTFGIGGTIIDGKIRFFVEPDKDFLYGPGTYKFTVAIESGRMDEIYHSPYSEMSPGYDVGDVIDGIKQELNDIVDRLEIEDLADLVDEVKDLNNAELATAMQNDAAVVADIRALDDAVKDADNLSLTVDVDEDKYGFTAADVGIAGAFLNATAPNSTLELNMHTPTPDEEVIVDDSQYKNWVQMDISLENAVNPLEVPVQISMPLPSGISPERLRILHYYSDGSGYEVIIPRIEGNFATFTLRRFSPFVFANLADPVVTNPSSQGGSGGILFNASAKVSEGGGVTIETTGSASRLFKVAVDGVTLKKGEDYTVENVSGKAHVVFSEAFLRTLAQGTHSANIKFENGTAVVAFTVSSDAVNEIKVAPPKTGSENIMWLGVLLLITGLAVFIGVKSRRSRVN